MSKSLTPKAPEFDSLLEDVMNRLRDIAETTGDKTEEALHAAAQGLAKSAQQLGAFAKTRTQAVTNAAVKEAKEHPVATAAIAATAVASAAAVVAVLLHRRKA